MAAEASDSSSAGSLPDWWNLPEQPVRKVRSDLLPRPDQATTETARASPPGSGTWKRLSRVELQHLLGAPYGLQTSEVAVGVASMLQTRALLCSLQPDTPPSQQDGHARTQPNYGLLKQPFMHCAR